jgi:photosystem II stability/assembly factor-like uncharacterized protein
VPGGRLPDAGDADLAFGDEANGYLLGDPPSSGMLVTNDGGSSWRSRQVPCSRASATTARLAPFGGTELYLVCAGAGFPGGSAKELLFSVDGALVFSKGGAPMPVAGMLDIAGSAAAGNLIVGLSLSTSTLIQTYGNEWTQVADTGMRDSRWRAIEFMDTSQAVALLERRLPAGTDSGSLYLTRDGGTTWAPVAFGTSLLPPACHSSSLSLMQPASSLAALGNFTVTLVLKNQGPGSCTLEGYPNLALYGSSGAALPIKVTHSPDSYIVTRRTIEP